MIPTLDEMLIRQDAIEESRLITTKIESTNELSMDHADLPDETICKATVEGTGRYHRTPAVRCTLSHAREVRGRVRLPAMRSRITCSLRRLWHWCPGCRSRRWRASSRNTTPGLSQIARH